MNTTEIIHIYKETIKNNQINDKCMAKPNIIFDIIAQHNPDRGCSTQAWALHHLSVTFSTLPWTDAPHAASSQVSTVYQCFSVFVTQPLIYSYNTYTHYIYFYYRSCTQYTMRQRTLISTSQGHPNTQEQMETTYSYISTPKCNRIPEGHPLHI
jgi:hypothetical protein